MYQCIVCIDQVQSESFPTWGNFLKIPRRKMLSEAEENVLPWSWLEFQGAYNGGYPLVSSNMGSWKIPELNGGFNRKITDFYGPFSGLPCLITGG